MRTMKSILAAAALMIGAPAVANAQWYVGLDGGGNYQQDPKVTGSDSNWGWVGLGQVGYNFGGPKVELEAGYRHNDDMKSWSAMVNGIYEFLPQSSWHPFLGAGIGWAWLDGDFGGTSPKNSDNRFAYQGIAGVSYDVSANLALKAQYRYFATLDTDMGPANDHNAEYKNHSVLVGFTYKFAAPAPTPAPVPAAAAAKQGNAARVSLTGHADRSGSDKYNMALSLKRANAVKDQLVKQGIPADQISVVGKGESEPLVPTPDGVREPQNRRVEIVLP